MYFLCIVVTSFPYLCNLYRFHKQDWNGFPIITNRPEEQLLRTIPKLHAHPSCTRGRFVLKYTLKIRPSVSTPYRKSEGLRRSFQWKSAYEPLDILWMSKIRKLKFIRIVGITSRVSFERTSVFTVRRTYVRARRDLRFSPFADDKEATRSKRYGRVSSTYAQRVEPFRPKIWVCHPPTCD